MVKHWKVMPNKREGDMRAESLAAPELSERS
jgi:hypothetical protein